MCTFNLQNRANQRLATRDFSRGKEKTREKKIADARRLFSRRIYEDPSLAFIETSGGREKGKAGNNSAARAKLLRAPTY